jgi:hypothetical protein
MGKTTQKRTCQKWRSRLDRYASGGRLPRGTRVKETGGYVLRPLSTASQNERVGMTRSFTGRSGTCARKWGADLESVSSSQKTEKISSLAGATKEHCLLKPRLVSVVRCPSRPRLTGRAAWFRRPRVPIPASASEPRGPCARIWDVCDGRRVVVERWLNMSTTGLASRRWCSSPWRAWSPPPVFTDRATTTASARTSGFHRRCVMRRTRVSCIPRPRYARRPRGDALHSPTHLFFSLLEKLFFRDRTLTPPFPPPTSDFVALPTQRPHFRRYCSHRVRLRVQALTRGEGTTTFHHSNDEGKSTFLTLRNEDRVSNQNIDTLYTFEPLTLTTYPTDTYHKYPTDTYPTTPNTYQPPLSTTTPVSFRLRERV